MTTTQKPDPDAQAPAEPAKHSATRLAAFATVTAALIGATATITAAVIQHRSPSSTAAAAARLTVTVGPYSPAPSASAVPTPPTPSAPDPTRVPPSASSASPETAAAQVRFQCTGTAPRGVIISYGSKPGEQLEADSLPFSAQQSVSTTATAQFVTARLGGAGVITCAVTVEQGAKSVTTSETAQGLDLANAWLCGSADGAWRSCAPKN